MSDHHSPDLIAKDERPIRFLFENSAFLILGTVIALFWANWSEQALQTHQYFFNQFELKTMFAPIADDGGHGHQAGDGHQVEDSIQEQAHDDHDHGDDKAHDDDSEAPHAEDEHEHDDDDGHDSTTGGEGAANDAKIHSDEHGDHGEHAHPITWAFLINDILMAFFFAIAAKEVWESMLPGGALSNPKKAAMPLLATFGGIAGPALLFLAGVVAFGEMDALSRGWAVPCATDIAFSYLVGRLIFGSGHPAIAFLLLLAIADDAAGLVIIAVAYPQQTPELHWLLLSVGAMVLSFIMARMKVYSFWWYLLIPGVMSWFGFYWAHIHPALGLVPIIPLMPHAATDLGMFAREELKRDDTLNAFEHWWKNPVEIILGLFGLCNAGVAFGNVGIGTWLVLAGLIIGKPLGITLCTYLGEKGFKLSVPDGMDYRDVVTLGFIAGIGFTVALFVSTAAFKNTDPNLDPIKMGALFSFGAAIISIVVAKALGVQTWDKKKLSLEKEPDK